MTNIRPMRQFEQVDCEIIYHECHPAYPKRSRRWCEAHPTLVIEVDREIVGFTSYSMAIQPDVCPDGEVMIGHGVYVRPSHRGKRYGRLLCDARLQVAREVGAKLFVGGTAPDNEAMIKLFKADGFEPYHRVPDAYPDGKPMLFFMGPIR